MTARIRVGLGEHDAATRTGLRLALERAGLEVHGEAGDAEGVLELAAGDEVEVWLVASDLPGGGIDVIRRLTRTATRARTLVLARDPRDDEFVEAVRAGAAGYLGQEINPDRLPAVIEAVAAGEAVVPRSFAAALLDEVHGRRRLRQGIAQHARRPVSDREWEVLQLLIEDLPTAEVARRLGISEVTARRHISSAVAKLGVHDRAAAVRLLRSDG